MAYTITDMMRSVVEQGTATKAKSLGLTIAGKTGTSNDARDTWFVGMTADVVVGVWAGNDDNSPILIHSPSSTIVAKFNSLGSMDLDKIMSF